MALNIEQYQNSELSPQLAELLKHPVLSEALATCDQASPANGGIKEWKEPHHAHIQLGVDRGFNLYPQILRLLATKPKATEAIEPTYEPTELAMEEK